MTKPATTIRERMVAAGELPDVSWDEWKAALIAAASKDDMGGINPDEYRDYYEDGYTAADAWAEDMSNG